MVESFIYQKDTGETVKNSHKFYGTIKDYDFIDDGNNPRINEENDNRVMAKIKVKSSGSCKYLIRLDNLKKIYDPTLDMSENKDNNLFKENNINFKEVNKKTFDFYLSFLKTMNSSWIRNAEREDF